MQSLEFHGPLGFLPGGLWPELSRDDLARVPGIYLWAVPFHLGGFLPLYVGETSASVCYRIQDHLIRTVGGYNRICDPAALVRGEARVLWNGLWRKGTRHRFPDFLSVVEQLVPAVREELRIEALFIAPLKIDNRMRRRIEGAIATHIKAQPPPASSVFPSDVRYYTRAASELEVAVTITCASQIHGLPDSLMA
jgi:hypothetical protein